MTRLIPAPGDNPRALLRMLRDAVHGAGPALALGGTGEHPEEVPAGTALVLTTSGSTGVPKSVVLSRSALISGALATSARVGDGAWLLALPASYIAGVQVLVRSITAGREPAILGGHFSAESFAALALGMASSDGGTRVPSFTALVPAQLATLLDAAAHDSAVAAALRRFEAILVGGQSLPLALRERAEAAGARLVRTYGSTETSGGCVYDGVPLDGTTVRVVDGELHITGPTLADGYLDDPARTDASFVRDAEGVRWYRTADAGTVDDGLVQVTGRIDNVIVSGGINVSLDRVERVVRELPGLAGAVIVGVPDERWGEGSVIVAPRAAGLDERVLLDAARAAVAAAIGAPARPARLVLLDALPALSSGKPDRRAIRESLSR